MTDDGIDENERPTDSNPAASDASSSRAVSFREALWIWVQVAAYSFGGPAGQTP